MKYFMRLILLCGVLLVCHCSSTDLFVRDAKIQKKPHRIAIGVFERRSLSIDSAVEKSIREAVRFELLKKGYDAFIITTDGSRSASKPEEIMKITGENKAEILLQGEIALNTSDALSSDNESMLSITLHDASGLILCALRYYTDKDITLVHVIREGTSTIIDQLDTRLTALAQR